MIASPSDDGTVGIWDTSSGDCISMLSGHSNLVYCSDWSPDGKLLATGSADSEVTGAGERYLSLPGVDEMSSAVDAAIGETLKGKTVKDLVLGEEAG